MTFLPYRVKSTNVHSKWILPYNLENNATLYLLYNADRNSHYTRGFKKIYVVITQILWQFYRIVLEVA